MNTTAEVTQKKKPIWLFALIGILLVGYTTYKIWNSIIHESTDNAQIESNATPIVSRLAGYVDSVAVKDYQEVKAGEVLLTIDNREYQLAVDQAQADLLSAQADMSNAQAQLKSAEVNRNVVKANLETQKIRTDKAKSDWQRDQSLLKENAITRKQADDSKSLYETAQKQLLSSQDQLAYAESQIKNSRAQIEKVQALIKSKQAALKNAELRLTYTKMIAPYSGKIGKFNLQKGQYVQPGQTLFNVIDNEQFWITANFKETQLEKLKVGMIANAVMDGYPNIKIQAKVSDFSDATGARFALLPPDNATGNFVKVTQRVPVKLSIENVAEVKQYLKAGLSVKVEIKTN